MRGEVVLPRSAFVKLNEEREAAGMAPAANPRNAAAGTIRTLEPNVVAAAAAGLLCVFFCCGVTASFCCRSNQRPLEALPHAGLPGQSSCNHS